MTCTGNCGSCGNHAAQAPAMAGAPAGLPPPPPVDSARQTWPADLTDFVCEEHPTSAQGHDGCGGAGMPLPSISMPAALDVATKSLIAHMATALADKLKAVQVARGYTNNWSQNNWEDECRTSLRAAIAKGDPIDVVAYAAFMWYHGWNTATPDASVNPDKCDEHLFANGVSVGLFDIPKNTANELCSAIRATTGVQIDWHYVAGRVHVKALPPDTVVAPQADNNGHDVRCLYEYALARLNLKDTPEMRLLFWDSHNALTYNINDVPDMPPSLLEEPSTECPSCSGSVVAQETPN